MNDAICALATPLGSGGIAVIRVSGDNIFDKLNSLFPKKNILTIKKNTAAYTSIHDEQMKKIDDVVLLKFNGPNSFTGEDVVEISCHCNRIIIEHILSELNKKDIRLAEPGEFSKRAFLNQKIDLTQAESIAALIEANNEYAVNNALNILDGKLSTIIEEMRQKLIQTAGLLEIDLDFSEEDLDLVDRNVVSKYIHQSIDMISAFIKKSDELRFVNDGIRLAIVGQPNAGKSSLLNVLLGKNRAIVSDIEGTTRDTIEEILSINGIPVKLIDTAGIRNSEDQIEKMGVQMSYQMIDKSDCVLLVVDSVKGLTEFDHQILSHVDQRNKKRIIVYNKIDLNPDLKQHEGICVSSIYEQGIVELKNQIISLFQTTELETSETIVVSNIRHKLALETAIACLNKAKLAIQSGYGNEIISIDIRDAIDELGKITGEITNNDILNDIFANFCIGK